MKRNYCLVFNKRTMHTKHGNLKVDIPMVLYRKDKKFHIDYQISERCSMNFIEAWYWYFIILFSGKNKSKTLFAYKNTNGFVQVKKMF